MLIKRSKLQLLLFALGLLVSLAACGQPERQDVIVTVEPVVAISTRDAVENVPGGGSEPTPTEEPPTPTEPPAPTPTLTPTQATTPTHTPTQAPSPTPMPTHTPAASPTPMPSPTPPAPPRRLPTGTVIQEAGARNGRGELTIKNGRDLDAVAVLTYPDGNPLIAVSIQSSGTFAITGIQDGTYRLYFSLGRDWDTESARFTRQTSFFRFEDAFPFETTTTETEVRWTTWEVTLYAVTGGTAGTESLPEGQFPDL